MEKKEKNQFENISLVFCSVHFSCLKSGNVFYMRFLYSLFEFIIICVYTVEIQKRNVRLRLSSIYSSLVKASLLFGYLIWFSRPELIRFMIYKKYLANTRLVPFLFWFFWVSKEMCGGGNGGRKGNFVRAPWHLLPICAVFDMYVILIQESMYTIFSCCFVRLFVVAVVHTSISNRFSTENRSFTLLCFVWQYKRLIVERSIKHSISVMKRRKRSKNTSTWKVLLIRFHWIFGSARRANDNLRYYINSRKTHNYAHSHRMVLMKAT